MAATSSATARSSLYVGRLVPEKGVDVLLDAWRAASRADATLVLIGDGPLAGARRRDARRAAARPAAARPSCRSRTRPPSSRVLPSIPTPRFREPWGLVCNEAMHQGRPVIASDAVGAVAGGLVRDGETGLVVPAGDARALRARDRPAARRRALRARLGAAASAAVAAYTYDAMVEAFDRALAASPSASGPRARRPSLTDREQRLEVVRE